MGLGLEAVGLVDGGKYRTCSYWIMEDWRKDLIENLIDD